MNVLPLVNKGLALYQWKQDIAAAERCCNEALRIDPECEAAVATLAQLSLQQSKIEKAVEMFERQAELARSEPELVNALTYQYVSGIYSIWFVGLFVDHSTVVVDIGFSGTSRVLEELSINGYSALSDCEGPCGMTVEDMAHKMT
jgi:tetratricopeptide (TPR) repeat protein